MRLPDAASPCLELHGKQNFRLSAFVAASSEEDLRCVNQPGVFSYRDWKRVNFRLRQPTIVSVHRPRRNDGQGSYRTAR